jgi:hypothetical protein
MFSEMKYINKRASGRELSFSTCLNYSVHGCVANLHGFMCFAIDILYTSSRFLVLSFVIVDV